MSSTSRKNCSCTTGTSYCPSAAASCCSSGCCSAACRTSHGSPVLRSSWPQLVQLNELHRALRYEPVDRMEATVRSLLMQREDLSLDVNARDQEGRTALHLAACTRNGESVVALLLVRSDVDVNATALFDLTPLHLAARLGYISAVDLLLRDRRLTLNAVTTDEFTAFHLVAEGRDQTSSAYLRSRRGSVQDRCEVVRLLLAEQKKRSAAVGTLQQQLPGCEFARDVLQRTPLHYAAENGYWQMVEELLANSCSRKNMIEELLANPWSSSAISDVTPTAPSFDVVNAVDVYGFTPVHLAVLHDHRRVVSLLLQAPGVDVNVVAAAAPADLLQDQLICNKGARRRRLPEVRMIAGAANVSDHLFPVTGIEPPSSSSAADIFTSCRNATPLHFAAKMGHTETMKLLLIGSSSAAGAQAATAPGVNIMISINARDSRGCTALHFAAEGRHEKAVELLLEQPGILLDAADSRGVTPLQHVVRNGHSKVVKLLLRKVVESKEMVVNEGKEKSFELFVKLLSLATDQRIHQEVAEFLLKELEQVYAHNLSRLVDGTLVHEAAREGNALHTQLIPLILRWRPGDANALDSSRRTPLHQAVINGHLDAVKALFRAEKGWRLRATQPDKFDKTPLEYAVLHAGPLEDHASTSSRICNLLLDRRDVMHQQKRLYDGFKNTANCTLVGGTLISGVAYMGWLQPPLGFTPNYSYPVQAPSVTPGTTFESFADGSNPFAVKFFIFNGLAFFYAMGALFAVAGALIFMNNKQRDGRPVHFVLEHATLNRISYGLYLLLYLSVLSMCFAFVAAGYAVLAPGQRPHSDHILFLCFFVYFSAAVLVLSYIGVCKIWKLGRNLYLELQQRTCCNIAH